MSCAVLIVRGGAELGGPGEPVVVDVGDDHLGGPGGAGDLRDEEADRSGAGDEHAVAEPDLGALHRPDRDGERLDQRAEVGVDRRRAAGAPPGPARPGAR